MDKRLKPLEPQASAALRAELYEGVATGSLSIGQAVRLMRRISRMTQPEFAQHRGISVQALRQIERDAGNPTIETLNKVAAIFSLRVGFVPLRRGR